MPSLTSLVTFAVAALLLNLAPGPDMLYVIDRSVGQGRRAGVVSALGIFVGCLFHIAAAAIGLAALLRSSLLAFDLIRYAGAIYLVYLGIRALQARTTGLETPDVDSAPLAAIFRQGVITNILNRRWRSSSLPSFRNSQIPRAARWCCKSFCWDSGSTSAAP